VETNETFERYCLVNIPLKRGFQTFGGAFTCPPVVFAQTDEGVFAAEHIFKPLEGRPQGGGVFYATVGGRSSY